MTDIAEHKIAESSETSLERDSNLPGLASRAHGTRSCAILHYTPTKTFDAGRVKLGGACRLVTSNRIKKTSDRKPVV
jgi:hypothetical protein